MLKMVSLFTVKIPVLELGVKSEEQVRIRYAFMISVSPQELITLTKWMHITMFPSLQILK